VVTSAISVVAILKTARPLHDRDVVAALELRGVDVGTVLEADPGTISLSYSVPSVRRIESITPRPSCSIAFSTTAPPASPKQHDAVSIAVLRANSSGVGFTSDLPVKGSPSWPGCTA
jgi:hypothetical protein